MNNKESDVTGIHGEKRVAVLIDFENIGERYLEDILTNVADLGMITVKRAYADWSARSHAKVTLQRLGIEPVHHFSSTAGKKNASDICLTVDAMELLYRNPVDIFVLVTSDSDFAQLARRLREHGKTVIGIGAKKIVGKALVSVCDRFFYVEDFEKMKVGEKGLSEIEMLVRKAFQISADDEGRVNGSMLHQNMLKLDPGFNFKSLGFKGFRSFLESLDFIRIQDTGPGDIRVMLEGGEKKKREQPKFSKRKERLSVPRATGAVPAKKGGEGTHPAFLSNVLLNIGPGLMDFMRENGGRISGAKGLQYIYRKTGKKRLRDFGVATSKRLFETYPEAFKGIRLEGNEWVLEELEVDE